MPRDPTIDLFRHVARHHGETWTPSDSPRFGANALRSEGRIYAARTRSHRLLLKLPPARFTELLGAKRAEQFESGGRVMRGWVTLAPVDKAEWIALADEARAFAAAATNREKK